MLISCSKLCKKKKCIATFICSFLSSGAEVQLACPGSGGGGEERRAATITYKLYLVPWVSDRAALLGNILFKILYIKIIFYLIS